MLSAGVTHAPDRCRETVSLATLYAPHLGNVQTGRHLKLGKPGHEEKTGWEIGCV